MKMILVCLLFGSVMVVTGARADDYAIEGVYCRFDMKELGNGLLSFLRSGSKCEVAVETPYGQFEYEQQIIPEKPDLKALWSKLKSD